jgi:hypothetical protein
MFTTHYLTAYVEDKDRMDVSFGEETVHVRIEGENHNHFTMVMSFECAGKLMAKLNVLSGRVRKTVAALNAEVQCK